MSCSSSEAAVQAATAVAGTRTLQLLFRGSCASSDSSSKEQQRLRVSSSEPSAAAVGLVARSIAVPRD
jgi:hypothetical protein